MYIISEGSFKRELCLIRDDYTVFNNSANTKQELIVYLLKIILTGK